MKRLRYKRVVIVSVGFCLIVMILLYMFFHRNRFYEYEGKIDTYVATYRQDNKLYTFDLKGFQKDEKMYLSLNDMYNMVLILDKNTKVYVDEQKHTLTYQMSEGNYLFDYGQNKIVYNNECVELKDENEYIYISHKNYYINVSFIEKTVLKNDKKIKFKNKNAIIQ